MSSNKVKHLLLEPGATLADPRHGDGDPVQVGPLVLLDVGAELDVLFGPYTTQI